MKLKPFTMNENGDLAAAAIGLTVFLVVVAYVMAPIGLVAMQSTNTTAAGVATGTNASIWNALVPISLAGLIIAVIYHFKSSSK